MLYNSSNLYNNHFSVMGTIYLYSVSNLSTLSVVYLKCAFHGLKVMGSNPSRIEVGVLSSSVKIVPEKIIQYPCIAKSKYCCCLLNVKFCIVVFFTI